MSILIERKKLDELSELIWFIWTLRNKDDVKLREKVYELWPRLLEIVDINSREGTDVGFKPMSLGNICRDQMDATVENWLLKISPYACENHNAFDLLQNLADISDKQPLEAQKIWIKMLQSYNYDYPEEAIRQIFKNLITLGTNGERKAQEVVDAYILHGIDRPRMWLAEMLIEKTLKKAASMFSSLSREYLNTALRIRNRG